jgi:hypothetical protein
MFTACRHIRTNGLRCKSPALEGKAFCYFHAKQHVHSKEPMARYANLELPVPEDAASIQLSIARISAALLNGSLDSKRAGQLFFGLQIAASTIDRKQEFNPAETVPSISQSDDGDDLAPELRVCGKDERCEKCPHAQDCPNYHEYVEDPNDPDVIMRTLITLGKHLDDPLPADYRQPTSEIPVSLRPHRR